MYSVTLASGINVNAITCNEQDWVLAGRSNKCNNIDVQNMSSLSSCWIELSTTSNHIEYVR